MRELGRFASRSGCHIEDEISWFALDLCRRETGCELLDIEKPGLIQKGISECDRRIISIDVEGRRAFGRLREWIGNEMSSSRLRDLD